MAKKETLELEIKALIGEAQKNVKAMQGEIKKLAENAKKAAPETRAIAEALNRSSGREIKRLTAEMKLFGGGTAGVKKQLNITKEAMIDLVDGGIDPASGEIQTLLKEYKKLEAESDVLSKKTKSSVESFGSLQQVVMQSAAAITFLKVAGAGLSLAGGALEAADAFESARGELGILLGDMEAGAALFDEMQAFNVKTPFNLDTIKQGTNMLLAAKTPLAEMNKRLTVFGDLSQGNSQKFTSFISAFSKSAAKGKADMEVLNVFVDQGVQIFDALGAVVGKSAKEIPKMASEGKISFDVLSKALEDLTAKGGSYYGAMELGAKSLKGHKDTLRESVKGLAASYGQMLMPAVKGVLELMTKLVNAINESPFLKGALAAAITAVVTALGILTIKMTASTVATWAAFAARQGLNIAMAATNPLLIAGVVAVTAATAGIVAFAAKHQEASKAANATALANQKMAQETDLATESLDRQAGAAKSAAAAYKEYSESLKSKTIENVLSLVTDLQKEIDNISSKGGVLRLNEMRSFTDLQKKLEIAKTVLAGKKDELASSFKGAWTTKWGNFKRTQSKDPYVQINYEEAQKKQEAYNAFVREDNKETLEQIAAYYQAKRDEITRGILLADREVRAKISKTQVDDLRLRRDKELAAFKGTQQAKLALAKYWGKQITAAQKKEADEQAAAEKEAFNKSPEGMMKNSALAGIANTEVGQIAAGKHPLLVAIQSIVKAVLSIENVSKLLNPLKTVLEGMLSIVRPLTNDALQPLVDTLLSFGHILGKSLIPIINMLATGIGILAELINCAIEPIESSIDDINWLFHNVIMLVANGLTHTLSSLGAALAKVPFNLLSSTIHWLCNTVIVPLGNIIISIFNGVISVLNKIPFVHIRKLDYLEDIGDKARDIADLMEQRKREITMMYERQKDRVRDELRAQISSLQAQYELGLLSRKDYERQAEKYQDAADKKILGVEREMSSTLKRIEANTRAALSKEQKQKASSIIKSRSKDWGQKVPVLGHVAGAVVDAGEYVWNGAKKIGKKIAGWFGFAEGTPEIPHDMVAQIHKGEMIVPRTFAEGVRSGSLSIVGGQRQKKGRGTNVYVTVNVGGSVIKKDDLVAEIYTGISEGIQGGRFQALPECA